MEDVREKCAGVSFYPSVVGVGSEVGKGLRHIYLRQFLKHAFFVPFFLACGDGLGSAAG